MIECKWKSVTSIVVIPGHEMKDCQGLEKEKSGEHDEIGPSIASAQNFIFVRLYVLREYLARELSMPNLPFPYDLERAIDDWVFMCFFVGNDFLPHLPSLEIREGAIDRLVNLYKQTVYKTKVQFKNRLFFFINYLVTLLLQFINRIVCFCLFIDFFS